MGRAIYAPTPEISKIGRVVGLNEGGTGGSTASDAVANLGGLSTINMGQPNGLLGLESNGRILPTLTDGLVAPTVSLTGKSTIVSRTSYTYKINNYDSATSYVVSVSAGTVSIVDDVITLRAPLALGNITLTINTESFILQVVSNRLLTPTITTPSNDVSNVGDRLRVVSSAAALTGSTEIGKLTASDGAINDNFGVGVVSSSDGLTIAVGAHGNDNVNGADAGAAYIYKFDGTNWIETKLIASDGAAGEQFGWFISCDNNCTTLLVGSHANDNVNGVDAGAVYIYRFDGINWIETKLIASDGAAGDWFGLVSDISNDGNSIVVGARYDDNVNGTDAGAAYIYRFDGINWIETKLIASDGAATDLFGRSVTMSPDGSLVVVGSYLDDNVNGGDAGAAYIYKFDGTNWIETKLIASDGAGGDQFGVSVDVNSSNDTVVIGTHEADNINGVNAGAAYIYKWDGANWIETKIIASDGATGDNFGWGVSIDDLGLNIIVSGFTNDALGVDAGAVYHYHFNGSEWLETKITASDASANDQFGWRVYLNSLGDTCIVGAVGDNSFTGAAYIYNPVFHEQTQYQVSVDPNFSTIIEDVTVNGNVTDYTLPNLSPANAYYVRLRYKSNVYGFTDWSNVIHLNTRLEFIPDKEVYKLIASDGAAGDQFGHSESISNDGNVVVVGAPFNDNVNGTDAGAAYVYKFDGVNWIETKLIASDGGAGDNFGYSVGISVDGNTIAVGAIYVINTNGDSVGAAYIYKFDGTSWIETKLMASDGAVNDVFGNSISVDAVGDTITVGAFQDDNVDTNAGAAYIYKFDGTNWIETKLVASDATYGVYFGRSVSVTGDGLKVAVGAYAYNANAGAVYIYKWDGVNWAESKVLASDAAGNDRFGNTVKLSSDGLKMTTGSYGNDDGSGGAGSAYIYKFDGTNWIETKLLASDAYFGDNLGWSTSISNDGLMMVSGAISDDDVGINGGSTYLFRFDGTNWLETKLLASDGDDNDRFGWDVALSGNGSTLLSASYLDDNVNGVDAGAIYVFRS